MAFKNGSFHTVSFIGFVVYIVVTSVDNSELKSQRNKKEHFLLLEDTCMNV